MKWISNDHKFLLIPVVVTNHQNEMKAEEINDSNELEMFENTGNENIAEFQTNNNDQLCCRCDHINQNVINESVNDQYFDNNIMTHQTFYDQQYPFQQNEYEAFQNNYPNYYHQYIYYYNQLDFRFESVISYLNNQFVQIVNYSIIQQSINSQVFVCNYQ